MGTVYWMVSATLILFVVQLWLLGIARRAYTHATGRTVRVMAPVRARSSQHPEPPRR